MVKHCRFISCNKCAILVGDGDTAGRYVLVGTGFMWEISGPSSEF